MTPSLVIGGFGNAPESPVGRIWLRSEISSCSSFKTFSKAEITLKYYILNFVTVKYLYNCIGTGTTVLVGPNEGALWINFEYSLFQEDEIDGVLLVDSKI